MIDVDNKIKGESPLNAVVALDVYPTPTVLVNPNLYHADAAVNGSGTFQGFKVKPTPAFGVNVNLAVVTS